MELWLVRHAIAADFPPSGMGDGDRPLTDEGRREFRHLCKFLVKQRYTLKGILSSPLLRARQTAEILAEEFDIPEASIVVTRNVAPGFDPSALGREVNAGDQTPVAAVGHQPDLGYAFSEYLGGANVNFGKGHIAAIKFDGAVTRTQGHLSWFVGPDIIEH